ncbi:MAG: right-handed parallel beta-helix repeat-containing protein [Cryobacterium sp.]|nr:right-handed parallel beta-helix repeat-containing protein [Cryobacterium sp.]MBX3089480.1 right-handed parallel beta-helix repeat-containing protein [Cryobacterium sp.]MCO5294745.1 right-handed parallel beta-helix repeat-containing protein [Homoserinimonas sp.]
MRRSVKSVSMVSAIAIGAAMVALVPAPAFAATYIVNSGSDDGSTVGTLRWAMIQADINPGPDTITITYTGTIAAGATDFPTISEDLTITGPGSGQLTVNAFSTAFTISNAKVKISGMRVNAPAKAIDASGLASLNVSDFVSGDPITGGGQISFVGANAASSLSLSSVTVEDGADDGIYVELNGGTAVLNGVTISNRGSSGLEFGNSSFGNLVIDNLNSSTNDIDGVLLGWTGGTVSISSSTANSNGESGFVLEIEGDTGLNASGLHADENSDTGFALSTLDTSSIEITGATANDGDGIGVAIENVDAGAEISLSGFEVRRNATGGILAAIPFGGPAGILGKLNISETTVADQTSASGLFGAIFLGGDGSGEINLDQVSVLDNTSSTSVFSGLVVYLSDSAKATITNSTVARNSAQFISGIAIAAGPQTPPGNFNGSALIQSVTISNNTALAPGLFLQDGSTDLAAAPNMRLLNSTISDNTSLNTGATPPYSPSVILQHVNALVENSILSGSNYADIGEEDSTVSINYSLIQSEDGTLTSAIASGIGNLTGVSPNLAALANNGGSTLTRLPHDNSPVLEAGDPLFSGLATDQRGQARVVGRLDMGAVELGPILADTGVDFGLPLGVAIFLLISGAAALEATRRLRRA